MDIYIKLKYNRVAECVVDGVKGTLVKSCRYVFLFDSFVIKFDDPTYGYSRKYSRQNKTELRNYANIDQTDKKYFAKILQTGKISGKFYIVQERVVQEARITKKTLEIFSRLSAKYQFTDVVLDSNPQGCINVVNTTAGLKIFDIGVEKFSKDKDSCSSQISLFK